MTLLVPSLLVSSAASADIKAFVIGALLLFNFCVVALFLSHIASSLLFSMGCCRSTLVASVGGEREESGRGELDLEAQSGATEEVRQPHPTEGTPPGDAGVQVVGAPSDDLMEWQQPPQD